MHSHGELKIHDMNKNSLWISKLITTSSIGGYYLKLQNDGNLVIYDAKIKPYWSVKGLSNSKFGVYLINYWPMSNLTDLISGANLFGGSNFMFTSDRFGAQNAAIYFNKGYLQVPEGVYFSGDFTVTTWINLKSYQSYSRFFDFGNDAGSDNVLLSMTGPFSQMHGVIFKNSSSSFIQTSPIINLNEWYFISFVLSGKTGYIYVNGNQVKTNQLNVPNSIIRRINYIGKSNWVNANADAIYDEFKIYQGALSSSDIMNEYQLNSNGKIVNYCARNYWPMSNVSDLVGAANLFGGENYSFVPDRFCSPNSAIYFNKGYLQVPEGVYFSGDFTVTAWIYLKSYQSNSRIFDFGNVTSYNVFLAMVDKTSQIEGSTIIDLSPSHINSTSIINLNEWYFISFVLSGTTGFIYVNGNQVANGTINIPNNLQRTTNYIGKSNFGDQNADAIYDEFKIYQGALSSDDIMNEYQLNFRRGIINYCPSNYWPMSNFIDVVSGADLFNGSSYSFTCDKYGSPNSAIYFNKGFLQVPTGVYFSGDFTVTAWIYLKSYQSNSRIFDFGNGKGNDSVGLAILGTTSQIYGFSFNGSSNTQIQTTSIINLNVWYFISFVLSGTTGFIYVNGNQVANGTLNTPNNITRANNYIGINNWAGYSNTDAIFDEIKIYQAALSSSYIMNDYKISANKSIIKKIFFNFNLKFIFYVYF
jgi:hypothetical protein